MSRELAKKTGHYLIIVGLFLLLIVFSAQVFAKEVKVIDIRKNIPLTNEAPVYTDYYLNAGSDLGIKPGVLFTLYRRISVIDRLGTNLGRPLALPIGKIKVIYVSKDLSVARLDKLESDQISPLLDFRGVMLGDLINVDSAKVSGESEGAQVGPQGEGVQGTNVSFQAKQINLEIETISPDLLNGQERMPANQKPGEDIETQQNKSDKERKMASESRKKASQKELTNKDSKNKLSQDQMSQETLPLIR